MRKGQVLYLLIDLIFSKKTVRYHKEYSKDWDEILNKIMDEGFFKGERHLYAEFTHRGVNYAIWTGNYPYSFGYAHKINDEDVPYSLQFRASEKTMKKLYDFLNEPGIIYEQERVKKMRRYITGKD